MQTEIKIYGVTIWGQNKLFQAFQVIQSLWQLLNTAIIAWTRLRLCIKTQRRLFKYSAIKTGSRLDLRHKAVFQFLL